MRACNVAGAIDIVAPHLFGEITSQHRGAIGAIERAEPRKERRDSVIPRRLELVDVNGQRVARLRALDIERTGLRIVVSRRNDFRRDLIGPGHGAVVAVFSPRNDARSGLDVMRGRHAAERVLQLLMLRNVAQDFLLRLHTRSDKSDSDHQRPHARIVQWFMPLYRASQFRRIALRATGRKVKALFWHLGVRCALEERGFRFTSGFGPRVDPEPGEIGLLVGSSAGSIFSILVAAGYDVPDIMESFLGRPSKMPPILPSTIFHRRVPTPGRYFRRIHNAVNLRAGEELFPGTGLRQPDDTLRAEPELPSSPMTA